MLAYFLSIYVYYFEYMNMNMNGFFYFKVYAELRYINAKSLPYVKILYSMAP